MHNRSLAVAVATLICATGAPAQLRQEINLNGTWEYVRARELDVPPRDDQDKWLPFEVPGLLRGVEYERAWFRRDFEIPETMAGLRIVLHFGGVKFNSKVRVNSEEVGGHFGGHEAFDVDITEVAIVGGKNRLELGCHDWTGVFIDNETDFSIMKERPTRSRSVPKDKILAPIGALNELFGPWDDVKLRAHPAVFVQDLFIKPSVRENKLRVEYTLENLSADDASVTLGAVVEDGEETALALSSQTVAIAAGEQATATLEAAWDNARYWSHEDPYLYHLRTTLSRDGEVVDDLRTRFGFREFWVEGPRFYLNGSRVNLLATSWWPSRTTESKEVIEEKMRAIKAANCVIFRTHTQPWREIWYETADEMGLMMIPEGAVWNDDTVYRIDDPKFWDNYAAHLKAMVDRDKDKASVVMYSLENEMYGSRLNDDSPAKNDLARMGELMHEWDPTRPIMYESDGDPLGVADVIGIHYPHEYPQFTKWPNTAYWMDEPLRGRPIFLNGATEWLWDRQKPVYLGEFLWIPSSDPSWHTVFFGDEAYLDYQAYRQRGKAESWRMAIQAYRYYEVGGISPWTFGEGGALEVEANPTYAAQQYAMQHTAAYVREYDHNFYAGETITRTADVYNDVLSPSDLVVRWALMDGEAELQRGEQSRSMEPGQRQEIQFEVTMPQVEARTELTLNVTITRDGEKVFEDAKSYAVFPPVALKAPAVTVGLYDPSGDTRAALEQHGLRLNMVDDLAAIPSRIEVLLIGAGAWEGLETPTPVIGGEETERGLMGFVQAGGRALVLEQSEYPTGMIPARLSDHNSTMTFPHMPEHPLLRDLSATDLKWWRPDNIVTSPEPPRPMQGAFKAIVVSGSRSGLAHAPLLELPRGQGTLVLSQMKMVERLGIEPAAGILLQNALDYLAGYQPEVRSTAVFCSDPATHEYLDGIGLGGVDITDDPAGADWESFDLLVACGPLGRLPGVGREIRDLLARGGTVLAHGLTPAELTALRPIVGQDLSMIPYKGAATRIPGAHPLSAFFANEDLYWLGTARSPVGWATKPLAGDMTDYVFAATIEGKEVTEYPHTAMTVRGSYSGVQEEWAALLSNGKYATVEIEVPEGGTYVLGVVAGGTPAFEVWPRGSVRVDGKRFGEFACQKGEFDTYTMLGRLTTGKHEVVVTFTNDHYAPPDNDRNLYVKAILLAAAEEAGGVTFLTSPPAVAVIERGEGRIVIDNINWDTTERNAQKAARYICGLLTGLGAEFAASQATVIEAETLDHDPTMNWYRADANAAYLGDNGYLVGKVRCARAGSYVLRIIARGTAVDGLYPVIAVEVDGEPVGEVELKNEGWRGYPLEVELSEGLREIKLDFINDEHRPPEDRNLHIDKIEVRPAG